MSKFRRFNCSRELISVCFWHLAQLQRRHVWQLSSWSTYLPLVHQAKFSQMLKKSKVGLGHALCWVILQMTFFKIVVHYLALYWEYDLPSYHKQFIHFVTTFLLTILLIIPTSSIEKLVLITHINVRHIRTLLTLPRTLLTLPRTLLTLPRTLLTLPRTLLTLPRTLLTLPRTLLTLPRTLLTLPSDEKPSWKRNESDSTRSRPRDWKQNSRILDEDKTAFLHWLQKTNFTYNN